MPIRSGLALQLGTAEETVYGTPVTVNKFYPIRSESLSNDIGRNESEGIVSGQRVITSDQWYAGKKNPTGDAALEVETKGFGRWFKHAMGGVVTSQPAAGPSPTVYLHTFTPGDLPTSQTVQVGKPDVSTGTVNPFTYHGVTIGSWKLEQKVDDFLLFTPSLIAEEEENSTGLAAVTYAAGRKQFSWVTSSYTLAGSPFNVKTFSLDGNNGVADDRYFQGSQLRKRPEEQAMRVYNGNLEGEFESLTAYQRFTSGTEVPLVATFTGPIIEDALLYQLVITANVRFDGTTPPGAGRGIIQQQLPFKVIDNTTTSLKLEYQTSDATP